DFQIRIQAPQGSRLEKTEEIVQQIMTIISRKVPENGISISSAFVGPQPAGSPINPIFLFTNSSHEAVLQVSIDQQVYAGSMEILKEDIRKSVQKNHPDLAFNFEPMELTEKIMGQGALTPIEVKVGAPQLNSAFEFASR